MSFLHFAKFQPVIRSNNSFYVLGSGLIKKSLKFLLRIKIADWSKRSYKNIESKAE